MVTHHHVIGSLAAAAALVAFLNSPKAQQAVERYLILIQKEIIELAHTLRETAHDAAGKTGFLYPDGKKNFIPYPDATRQLCLYIEKGGAVRVETKSG